MPLRKVIIVPLRMRDRKREVLWKHTADWLSELSLPIYVADSGEEPWFNRSASINKAALEAGPWDMALIADADTIAETDAVFRTFRWVEDTRGAARPHLERFQLTEKGTGRFLTEGHEVLSQSDFQQQMPGGGLTVVHRACYDTVGGYDEAYAGWGGEDTAFNIMCIVKSRFDRLPGRAWHLYHERMRWENPVNKWMRDKLYQQYGDELKEWQSNQLLPANYKVL